MARKSGPPVVKILRQVLLLALPWIIKTLRNRAAKPGADVRVTDRTTPIAKTPTKAKKRKADKPLPEPRDVRPPPAAHKPSPIAELHHKKRSDVIVADAGVVVHVLPDDNDGSRHQRFLLEVDHTDITVKISHNIDLAPRVPAKRGDRLTFKGEYEYNELGGALHWTHHDPKKWRDGGWIDHNGTRYE